MNLQQLVTDFVLVAAAGEPIRVADIVDAFDEHDPGAVRVALTRAVAAGELSRPSRGMYALPETNGNVVQIDTAENPTGLQIRTDLQEGEEEDGTEGEETSGRIPVEGVIAVEGEITGDGRMIETDALEWEGVLPFAIIWDRQDGDHSGATVGAIEMVERRDGGVIWGAGYLSGDSEDEETRAAVGRVGELLDEGAVGVSIRFDTQDVEIRVKRELLEREEVIEEGGADDLPEEDDEGRVIVWRAASDDVLEVTTHGRIRHLAIVDTAAFAEASIAVAASGALTYSGDGRWAGCEHFFDNPRFGLPGQDERLRYDPERGAWSCPPTVLEDGRVFGHINPMGICLRGRPERCVTPPDANLNAFMRHHAPAAGGQRTGVICVGGSHCDVGIGAAEATRFYDQTGRAVADVRVGRDAYGNWFAGALRPGARDEDVYAFAASDVSGHWEASTSGRMELCGLPAVNVGGFPKGYLTWDEVQSGIAASAAAGEEDCGCTETLDLVDDEGIFAGMQASLKRIEQAVAPLYANHLASTLLDSSEEEPV